MLGYDIIMIPVKVFIQMRPSISLGQMARSSCLLDPQPRSLLSVRLARGSVQRVIRPGEQSVTPDTGQSYSAGDLILWVSLT